MGRLQKTAAALTAICALSGTGFIAAFVFSVDPGGHRLAAAGAVAAACLASLLYALLVVSLTRQRGEVVRSKEQGDNCRWLKERQELLDIRLHIDEPRLCSHHEVACTCWSLCGPVPPSEGISKIIQFHHSRPEETLAVVARKAIDDCPFRYARPVIPADS
jgi:hypothetical protein